MAQLFRAGCMLTVLCLVAAQTDDDLARPISDIFAETGENTTTKNPPSTGQRDGVNLTSSTTGDRESAGNCTCVPYYLCKPNPIVRIRNDTCEHVLHICCASGDIVESEAESDRPPQN